MWNHPFLGLDSRSSRGIVSKLRSDFALGRGGCSPDVRRANQERNLMRAPASFQQVLVARAVLSCALAGAVRRRRLLVLALCGVFVLTVPALAAASGAPVAGKLHLRKPVLRA